MANPFSRYKLQILAHSALSTGVEDDVIEEDDTTAHWDISVTLVDSPGVDENSRAMS